MVEEPFSHPSDAAGCGGLGGGIPYVCVGDRERHRRPTIASSRAIRTFAALKTATAHSASAAGRCGCVSAAVGFSSCRGTGIAAVAWGSAIAYVAPGSARGRSGGTEVRCGSVRHNYLGCSRPVASRGTCGTEWCHPGRVPVTYATAEGGGGSGESVSPWMGVSIRLAFASPLGFELSLFG